MSLLQIIFILARVVLAKQPATKWHYAATVLTSLLYAVCFTGISAALGATHGRIMAVKFWLQSVLGV